MFQLSLVIEVFTLITRLKDAFDYFNGTGFYTSHQDPKFMYNIYDTRKSFLVKMRNSEMRQKFLNSYNKQKLWTKFDQ